MTENEKRDVIAAAGGFLQGDAVQVANPEPDPLVERIAQAELCLARLREEANKRRYAAATDEDRELVKLLDEVGSPLAYLMGFAESFLKRDYIGR
jgi:hypothetical protein